VGYGIFDADAAQWLIPFLQKRSDAGNTIGNILKALSDTYTHTYTITRHPPNLTMPYLHTGTFRFCVHAGFIGFLCGKVPSQQHVAVSSDNADADEHPIQNLTYYAGDSNSHTFMFLAALGVLMM
jgi:hypothetical protein